MGPDCSMITGGALKGLLVADGGLCDTSTGDCGQVIVYGDNFVDTGNIGCQFTKTKVK
jgi:hypothetical protein